MTIYGWQMPMAVAALLLALLASAALARRYQEYRAVQRGRLRVLVDRVRQLQEALDALARVPLSTGLRSALHEDVRQLYVGIRAIHPGFPDIGKLLAEADQRVRGDGGATSGRVPAVEDEVSYRRLLAALDHLIAHLRRGPGSVAKGRRGEQAAWLRELRERRAEVLARYHIVAAHRAQREEDKGGASQHLQYLLGQLLQHGPDTDFVRDLYAEAEECHRRAMQGRPIVEAPEDGRADQSSAA